MTTLGTMKEVSGTQVPELHNQVPSASAIPPRIREKVAAACRNALETCAILGALAMSPAQAVEAPVQKVSVEASINTHDIMKAKGFSDISIQSVQALSDFIRQKQATGGIAPTEVVSVVDVGSITPDGRGLDQLVNSGIHLEKKTFRDVTKQDNLSSENYKEVVESLFDTSDIETWLTKADGTPMSTQEMADYRTSLVNAKTRWQVKLPELMAAGKQEAVTRWFALFNALANKPIHGSREEYRRGFIAANSMAIYSALSPRIQKLSASITATQAAEYVLMIYPSAANVKIERDVQGQGSLKYMVASDQSLKNVGFPEGAEVNRLAFQKWSDDQAKVYELHIQLVEGESKLAQTTSELEASKAKLAGNEAKLAGNEAKLSRLDESFRLQEDTNTLSKTIMEQLEQLGVKRGDKSFVKSLNENLQKWKVLQQKVQDFVAGDPEGKYLHPNERTSLLALFDTILRTATVKGLS